MGKSGRHPKGSVSPKVRYYSVNSGAMDFKKDEKSAFDVWVMRTEYEGIKLFEGEGGMSFLRELLSSRFFVRNYLFSSVRSSFDGAVISLSPSWMYENKLLGQLRFGVMDRGLDESMYYYARDHIYDVVMKRFDEMKKELEVKDGREDVEV